MVSRFTGIFKRNKEPDCQHVRDLSSDYIDEELNPDMVEKVRTHLGWCAPCRAFVRTLRATVELLRASPKREAPDSLRDQLRETLRNEGQQ